MKTYSLVAVAMLASVGAFAQTTPGTGTAQESNANATAGSKTGAAAQAKVDAKAPGQVKMQASTAPEANANAAGRTPGAMNAQAKVDAKQSGEMSPRMKAMDTNGDGMVSKEEWMAYHTKTWSKFKLTKGKAMASDVDAAFAAGPN